MLTIPLFAVAAVLLQEYPSALPSPVVESVAIEVPIVRLKHGDPEIAGLMDMHWITPFGRSPLPALPPKAEPSPAKKPLSATAAAAAQEAPIVEADKPIKPVGSLQNAESLALASPSYRESGRSGAAVDKKIPAEIDLSDSLDPRLQTRLQTRLKTRLKTLEATIREGDSLSLIFNRFGISDKELALITEHDTLRKRFKRIQPNQSITLHVDDESRVQRMMYRTGPIHFLDIKRKGESFVFEEVEEVPDIVRASASGLIKSSFDAARLEAGLPAGATDQVEDILKWDMDFSRDLHPKDTFSLIYEKKMKDGKIIRGGFGPILAVEFINKGKSIRAVRYEDPQGHIGYFTPDGNGMQKAFLRSPVATARISSRFSHARRHPILHKIRPHKGVDYAAPIGTRVMAVGDGKVQFVGPKGNYGRTIILKHHSGYSTLYAHLSRYAKGIRAGARVSQGQLIGFIGNSGLSTGPHLHYEFRINGVHKDPLTIRLPSDAPVPKKYRKHFRENTRAILTQLDIVSRPSVASSN